MHSPQPLSFDSIHEASHVVLGAYVLIEGIPLGQLNEDPVETDPPHVCGDWDERVKGLFGRTNRQSKGREVLSDELTFSALEAGQLLRAGVCGIWLWPPFGRWSMETSAISSWGRWETFALYWMAIQRQRGRNCSSMSRKFA